MMEPWSHRFVNVNGLRMHYVTQGSGKLVLLLHGFPDFWYVWRLQIPELAKHFQVVAPDLRGYNKTDKPVGVDNYRLNLLAGDIRGLMDALDEEVGMIVGHDWGGAIAWSFAAFHPTRTEKLAILNAPHPNAYTRRAKLSLRQLQKSWYVFFFQTFDIPEEVLSRNKYSFLKKMVKSSFVKAEALTEEDLRLHAEAWSQPGALTAMLNYYRANMNPSIMFLDRSVVFPKISAPTLIVWGEQDVALSKGLSDNIEEFVDAQHLSKYIPTCGHWVQLEEPKLVNEYLTEFFES
ncbi:MAG: alpha/beta hydrolase [Candidatus Bathyarchaeota archaeon]|nr:MAG: alpha/beta hydrolase [Candidatus Bathyarchaeota archaeon]